MAKTSMPSKSWSRRLAETVRHKQKKKTEKQLRVENQDKSEMLPPWKKYPEINRFSIGWRMGYGESYLIEWWNFYAELSEIEKKEYRKKHPQPLVWFRFYKMFS